MTFGNFPKTFAVAGLLLLANLAEAQMPPPPGPPPLQLQDFNDTAGFTPLFDGSSLDGWDGEPGLWRVEDGAIVAEREYDSGGMRADFLIWTGGEVGNFEIKYEVKVQGSGNGGLQFRSRRALPSIGPGPGPGPEAGGANDLVALRSNPYNVQGYQADVDVDGGYAGQLFEGGLFPGERGITTRPGQVVSLGQDRQPLLLGSVLSSGVGTIEASHWKKNGWNQFRVIAQDRAFMIFVNGQLMSVTLDEDPVKYVARGILALQLEGTRIAYRNLWLRDLEP